MKTLGEFIVEKQHEFSHATGELTALLSAIKLGAKIIHRDINKAGLVDILGASGAENVQGEVQQKLDLFANEKLKAALRARDIVAGIASEEEDEIVVFEGCEHAKYVVLMDPLDGSSNIDINVSIGSIFSVLPAVRPKREPVAEDFLMPGTKQVAAGYCMYGPQTQLVLTFGRGVVMFTLDPTTGTFMLTAEDVRVDRAAKEFAINCSNLRHWEDPVKRYVAELLEGKTGVRGKDFNMRWVAAMVAEVHRILQRGGIFMYPRDHRDLTKPGKLRLMYEANPMSMLMENAGAAATNGHQRILDIVPEKIHQRVAVFLGAADEVERVTSYHAE